jgi:hypothetical protein
MEHKAMEYDLSRFLEAQELGYPIAREELISGQKRSHWMWYIFPQLRGLGSSAISQFYGITSLDEAREYLAHPLLGQRLRELTQILLGLEECQAEQIFGEIDALKLFSSLTLFDIAEPYGDFSRLLDKFFDGRRDTRTEEILRVL